jgi:hypothetical protein
METLLSVYRNTDPAGQIIGHNLVVSGMTYSMSYNASTGEWTFNQAVPAEVINMEPVISNLIAATDF